MGRVTLPTWQPIGGPEMDRWDGEATPDVLARFRAHKVSGGHQKPPDQRRATADGWYVPIVDRRPGEAILRTEARRFRSMVADKGLFDRLMVDDGSCGGAEWIVEGRRVTSTSIWSAYYACRIVELTEGRDIQTVVDIGGGYGHLAHVLAGLFPHVVLVELPIVLALAREWSAAHPQTNLELRLPDELWRGDLVINTMSMQHMTPRNLDWYAARFRAEPPACMYLVNRVVKRHATDVEMNRYPFLSLFDPVAERKLTGKHVEWFGTR